MKITVHMCSRGRQFKLVAALASLHDNESGKHEVRYAVACDVDDPVTIGTLQSLQAKMPLGYRVGERPISLDALHNQLALDMPAEVYVCFIDDALNLTKDWDDLIAQEYAKDPKGLWWWRSKGKDITLMPITSEAWRQAAGKIFPEHFPYWWGDTWLSEVYALATESALKFAPVDFIDCPVNTHNMRELAFWHDFYLWLQPERIAEAKAIAEKLGLPKPTVTEALARFTGAPNKDFMARRAEIEADQGDHGPPHEGYRLAKARAQEMMARGHETPIGLHVSLDDLLTPEVVATIQKHFPEMGLV